MFDLFYAILYIPIGFALASYTFYTNPKILNYIREPLKLPPHGTNATSIMGISIDNDLYLAQPGNKLTLKTGIDPNTGQTWTMWSYAP